MLDVASENDEGDPLGRPHSSCYAARFLARTPLEEGVGVTEQALVGDVRVRFDTEAHKAASGWIFVMSEVVCMVGWLVCRDGEESKHRE